MNTAERIASQLLELGVRPGGVLLVHSSLRSFGQVPGGARTVVDGLVLALGDAGTLLLPALSYEHVTRANPRFDVRSTRSNVGLIPETFRTMQGTVRSVHPTHSVCALGARAKELTDAHVLDRTPVGEHSPFRKVRDTGGQLLMLGCGLEPNTSMHGVEELARPPYLFGVPIDYTIVHDDGHEEVVTYTPHGFDGWNQRYDRIGELLTAPALRTGRVLEATCHLIEATELWSVAEHALRRDPLCFVERSDG